MHPGIEQARLLRVSDPGLNLVSRGYRTGKFRAAGAARDSLGMVAPASGIAVFSCTGRAQRKVGHGSPFAVIGDFVDDAVAGPQFTQEVAQ